MQISELDGFLIGIVVGPELVMPSEWIPCIWQDEELTFNTKKQAERILGTIMARYNEIISQLDDVPGALEPILYSSPDGKMLAADWAEGFMDAVSLREDEWEELFNVEDDRYLMSPIMALLQDMDGNSFVDITPEEFEKVTQESALFLPVVIKEIYEFWKERRSQFGGNEFTCNGNNQPFGNKVGRNEPCIRGSGRKYKRCCGNN